jgi:hypothetical protein
MEATRGLAADSPIAKKMTAIKNNEENGQAMLSTSDEDPNVGVIYIYNCVPGLQHAPICQPPNFPNFKVPECKPGQKVGYSTIRALIKNRFTRPGTDETYYIQEDGRKHANSLLNPSVHPSSPWETQLREIAPGTPGVAQDQYGNNMNAFGIWWSLTAPDDPALDGEIQKFKARFENTCRGLIAAAEEKAAKNERHMITPREHFAMEYLGLEANWHQTTARFTNCPNCGERIREGIAYHKNFANDVCVIDAEKYYKIFPEKKPRNSAEVEEEETVPAAGKPGRKARTAA